MKLSLSTSSLIFSVLLSGTAHAGTIILNSQPGLANSLTAATVAITPHSAWEGNNPQNPFVDYDSSAVWISFAPTGYGDSTFQPTMGTTPVVSIFHNFTSSAGNLSLYVWADDTAEVLLDGVSIFAPQFTQSTCSGQPIGCQPQDYGLINTSFGSGSHQLEFRLFQVGTGGDTYSNPIGLLYTGAAVSGFDPHIPTETPEPATLALAGCALIGIAIASKVRRRAQ